MKKWIISSLVFILSLTATAFVGFYTAIFLIGPHSDVLLDWFHIPVGIILLVLILGIPVWLGRKTFIKFKRNE
jgi:hypothetical protein